MPTRVAEVSYDARPEIRGQRYANGFFDGRTMRASGTAAPGAGLDECENRVDRFTVPAPGEPKVETISGLRIRRGFRAVSTGEQGRARYSLTVVDYSDAERIHSELGHIAYQGGPKCWTIDIMASIDYAAMLYRQKPGVKVTYDAWHYIERVTGHELQLTNSDESRSYIGIYLHENRLLTILDATAGRDEAPPIIFQQSFGFLDAEGKPVQYATSTSIVFLRRD